MRKQRFLVSGFMQPIFELSLYSLILLVYNKLKYTNTIIKLQDAKYADGMHIYSYIKKSLC